jgi:hypothetical protein
LRVAYATRLHISGELERVATPMRRQPSMPTFEKGMTSPRAPHSRILNPVSRRVPCLFRSCLCWNRRVFRRAARQFAQRMRRRYPARRNAEETRPVGHTPLSAATRYNSEVFRFRRTHTASVRAPELAQGLQDRQHHNRKPGLVGYGPPPNNTTPTHPPTTRAHTAPLPPCSRSVIRKRVRCTERAACDLAGTESQVFLSAFDENRTRLQTFRQRVRRIEDQV